MAICISTSRECAWLVERFAGPAAIWLLIAWNTAAAHYLLFYARWSSWDEGSQLRGADWDQSATVTYLAAVAAAVIASVSLALVTLSDPGVVERDDELAHIARLERGEEAAGDGEEGQPMLLHDGADDGTGAAPKKLLKGAGGSPQTYKCA